MNATVPALDFELDLEHGTASMILSDEARATVTNAVAAKLFSRRSAGHARDGHFCCAGMAYGRAHDHVSRADFFWAKLDRRERDGVSTAVLRALDELDRRPGRSALGKQP